ncbi:MAG: hypothetical protein PHU85_07395 [Phycisphaerae bacterium]|nr:hypothetical protein [Phycisphaerae bacterium]
MRIRAIAFVALAGLILLGGCASGQAGAGPWTGLPDEPVERMSPAEMTYTLVNEAGPVSQNRAYQAFLMWIDGKDDAKNFGQRIATLQERGVLDASWRHDPVKPLTRGRLASMICRHQHIRSSVALALLGPGERNARRELIFRGVMDSGGGDWDGLAGAEFVNVLKKADEQDKERDSASGHPGENVP